MFRGGFLVSDIVYSLSLLIVVQMLSPVGFLTLNCFVCMPCHKASFRTLGHWLHAQIRTISSSKLGHIGMRPPIPVHGTSLTQSSLHSTVDPTSSFHLATTLERGRDVPSFPSCLLCCLNAKISSNLTHFHFLHVILYCKAPSPLSPLLEFFCVDLSSFPVD